MNIECEVQSFCNESFWAFELTTSLMLDNAWCIEYLCVSVLIAKWLYGGCASKEKRGNRDVILDAISL